MVKLGEERVQAHAHHHHTDSALHVGPPGLSHNVHVHHFVAVIFKVACHGEVVMSTHSVQVYILHLCKLYV